ncbi:SNF2 helicase associated domain-containing protein, partial [Clostridium sp.]|uniref:SNF2 helicase associated domain-containing protein n=1 Tax=Clostridium sp. TaxID=1506 RepID=UPI002612BF86
MKNYNCFHIIATAYKYYSIILKKEKHKIKAIKNSEVQNKDLVNKDLIEKGLNNEELKEEILNLKDFHSKTLINEYQRTFKNINMKKVKVSNYNIEKVNSVKTDKEEIKIKEKLKLDINIKEDKVKNEVSYYVELRTGKGNTITVETLGNFLYTLNKLDYTKEDSRVLEFLIKILKTDNKRIIEGRKFIIKDSELRILLSLIDKNKTISFVYDYMTYKTKIIKENIPYIFTVKKRDNQIILTNQKKMNIKVDENNTVWIYDKKIYLPSKEQIDFIIPMYQKLKEQNKVIYKYSKENLSKIIYILGKIAKEINIEDNLRNEVNEINKIEFYIIREDNNLYCNFKINYINSLEALKDNKFLDKIDMVLE